MSGSFKGDADHNSAPAPERLAVPRHGRLLGIDFGTRRVGFAVSDEEQRLSVPLETYTRSNREHDARHLTAVIGDYRIRALVIGLPLHMGGEEGIKAGEARQFGAWAAGVSGLPFAFWDERLTTSMADEHLAAANINPKKRKLLRDKIAAQIMLQSYLDSRAARARAADGASENGLQESE
ncbi:MAG TPA: Holliday junction resolvase RuvX [Planctomycetaceae bacterium]|jgi:putative Holliday junction resolvase|nr:Holliday junction resolvase RuvX [Planctomycetaceae bacterium]